MIVSHKNKFIFLKPPKTAGTSVEVFLEQFCDKDTDIAAKRGDGTRLKTLKNIKPHMSAKDVKRKFGEDIWNKYFKFTIIRNPWDAHVSRYWFINKNGKNMSSFKKNTAELDTNYLSRYLFINNEFCLDSYIFFENLEEDLKKICIKLNLNFDSINLPYKKSGYRKDKGNYRSYYNEKLKNIIYKTYKKEIEMFNYEF